MQVFEEIANITSCITQLNLSQCLTLYIARPDLYCRYLTRDYYGEFINEQGKCGPVNRWRIRSKQITTFSPDARENVAVVREKYGEIVQNPPLVTAHNSPEYGILFPD